jgi:hypothetical protein
LQYARGLEKGGLPAIELSEGGNDDDEMFWIILGNEEFANADYWKWRATSAVVDPHIWRVDGEDLVCHKYRETSHGWRSLTLQIIPVDSFSYERQIHSSVYIIDCVWELYIVVGRDARSQKRDITFAISVASVYFIYFLMPHVLKLGQELSTRIAPERPFTPTVHVLVLPTQLPQDLRINLRGLDEQLLVRSCTLLPSISIHKCSQNNGDTPDYMNILSDTDALNHVGRIPFIKGASVSQPFY